MKIKPLWLREKLYYRLYRENADKSTSLFAKAPLEFAPKISLKLLPTDEVHRAIAFMGFYELKITKKIALLAHKGGTLIDVGASYGYYSCLWAGINPNNTVLAFEPSPQNIPALKLNVRNNSLESQVKIFEKALGKENKIMPFSLGPKEQPSWGVVLVKRKKDSIQMPLVRLDDVLLKQSKYKNIDVLKIDAEGADTWVIQGAKQSLLEHRVSHVFFEENIRCMKVFGIKSGEAQTLLKEYGYSVECLEKGRGISQWHARI